MSASADPAAVMATIGEIAERDGISKQAVSTAVAKLIDSHGLPVERDARGRVKRVSLVHWDRLRGHYVNPAKRPADKAPEDPSSTSYEEARRRNEWYKAHQAALDLQERAGQLVRADYLSQVMERIGREAQAIIMRLPNRADDLAISVGREGTSGLRNALRKVAFEVASEIGERLVEIGRAGSETDPPISDEHPFGGPMPEGSEDGH